MIAMRRAHGLQLITVLTLLAPALALAQNQPPNPHTENIAKLNKKRAQVAVRQFFIGLCIQQTKLDMTRIDNAETEELAGYLAIFATHRLQKVHSALWHIEHDGIQNTSDFDRLLQEMHEHNDDEMLKAVAGLWRIDCMREQWLPGSARESLQRLLKKLSTEYALLRSQAVDAEKSSRLLDRILSEERKLAAEHDRTRSR
jgi:hypothetical protein